MGALKTRVENMDHVHDLLCLSCYRAMLADRGYEIACPSVRLWRWGMFSHRLEFFENNITAQ